MENSNFKPDNIRQDAVNLVSLFRTIWDGRWLISKITLWFLFGGLILAFVIPKEYTAVTVMVPQISDPKSKLGGLSGLAAMAGFNLNITEESEITPKIYPQIITSPDFQLELMQTRLKFKGLSEPVTLFDYYTEIRKPNLLIKYTINLPWIILKAIRGKNQSTMLAQDGNNPIEFNDDQIEVQKIIKDKISVFVNDVDGSVVLSCSMPEAVAAAQLTQNAQNLLKKYITDFKIEKALANEAFVQERYNEAEKNFEAIQDQLALFRDRNKNFATAVARTELERLTNKFTIISGVYGELAKKLEQAKIQVKEETPVFTIVKPVMVPPKKSKPNRPSILIYALLLGLFAGSVTVTWRDYFLKVKQVWGETGQNRTKQ